ncbi:MAG: DNA adenine methylase [Candidatus Didemnitutus sp.]|nr:DNA adenine methylase [Candidatus Didemnitutus sp.]
MADFPPDFELPKPRPVVSWAGGKGKLLQHILPLIPKHTCYVEVFGGSLAVFLSKQPSDIEVVNDINGELVSFYRCCKFHLDALLDELDLVLNSRREFEDYCAQPGLTEIQRAARWFIRNKLSFAGHGEHFTITRTTPHTSRAQRLIAIRALNRRLDRTSIENRTWELMLKAYDSSESFFFLDPPYPEAGGKCYGGWDEVTVERFCTEVKALHGQWLFTFKDCDQVRDLMAGYTFHTIDRARGIANNTGAKKAARYLEIVITSEKAPRRELRKGKTA